MSRPFADTLSLLPAAPVRADFVLGPRMLEEVVLEGTLAVMPLLADTVTRLVEEAR